MRFSFAVPALALALGVFAHVPAAHGGNAGKKVWISLGETAYSELVKAQPQARAIAAVDVAPAVLDSGRVASLDRGAASSRRGERVHLVRVDEAALTGLSEAIHQTLRRCGGYRYHASEADGRQALMQLAAATAQRTSTLAPTRPSYVIDKQTVVSPMLSQMQASNIAQTIQELSNNYVNRYYQTAAGAAASDWLKQKWTAAAGGRTDITVEQFVHAGWRQKSVILTIKGSDNGAEVVVLGAHLDSIAGSSTGETTRAPGADDDASGVASLTEIIRTLSAGGFKPRRTLKFMAFAAEEVGLRGSAEIANSFAAAGTKVVGMMQLDMTNFKGSASDIYLYTDYTDSAQNTFLSSLVASYLPTLKVATDRCGYGCSDHASWTAKGYYASLPFEAAFANSNRNIHTANDTFANSGNTADHSLKFARLGLAYAVELGSDGPGTPPPNTDKTETFTGSLALNQTKSFGPFKAAVGTFKASTTGTGDIDLYAKRTTVPTTSSYDCRSAGSTSTEACSISLTANGNVYVLLKAYAAGTYKLNVTYKPQ